MKACIYLRCATDKRVRWVFFLGLDVRNLTRGLRKKITLFLGEITPYAATIKLFPHLGFTIQTGRREVPPCGSHIVFPSTNFSHRTQSTTKDKSSHIGSYQNHVCACNNRGVPITPKTESGNGSAHIVASLQTCPCQ